MASLTKFSQKIIHKNDQEYVVQFWKVQIYLTLVKFSMHLQKTLIDW